MSHRTVPLNYFISVNNLKHELKKMPDIGFVTVNWVENSKGSFCDVDIYWCHRNDSVNMWNNGNSI